MNIKKRALSFLLVAVLISTSFIGCSKREDGDDSPAKGSGKPSVSTTETVSDIVPHLTEKVAEKQAINPETTGWVQVPGTSISDVVVQSKVDNYYYWRINFDLEHEFQGVYYNDYRQDFGEFTREDLPVNNVIYGHALTDNKESENYDIRFAPLHDFRDIEFAKENPYIFFSTTEGDFVYEIVSVFEINSNNPEIPYNKGNAEDMEGRSYQEIVRDEMIPRSLYDYGVKINDDDKFITLSTCIYTTEDGTVTNYPHTQYRYGLTGRLIAEDTPLVEVLDLKMNEDRIIDPHTL